MRRSAAHLTALLPACWLGWQVWLWISFGTHDLTANPIQYINQYTGDWAIRFILLTLAITPLRRIFKWHWLIGYRRMVGLYAFFYAVLHLCNFIILDHFFDWGVIWQEIIKRPAITFGMSGLVMLLPLAVTSTKGMIRRLGRKWGKLHQLVYLVGIVGVVHNIMMVKTVLGEPYIHLAILVLLLAYRVWPMGRLKGIFA